MGVRDFFKKTFGGKKQDNDVAESAKYSEGLEFELSETVNSYVVKGLGKCTDTDIVIPDEYNGKPVTEIKKHAFLNAQIKSVNLSGIQRIDKEAFCQCMNLEKVIIPSNYSGLKYIGEYAFENCASLKEISIPDTVIDISFGAFDGCSELEKITVDENNPSYKSIDGNLYSKDGEKLIKFAPAQETYSFNIPDGVTTIIGTAFRDSMRLEWVTMTNSVTEIGNSAFEGCTRLNDIDLSSNLKTIEDYAFAGCKSLKLAVIPDDVWLGDNVFPETCDVMGRSVYNAIEGDSVGSEEKTTAQEEIVEEEPLLPDYLTKQDETETYNVSERTAQLLETYGIKAVELPQGKLSIEKSRWEEFINSPEGQNYAALKCIFNSAASKVINEDLSYVNGTDGISNALYDEYASLRDKRSGADLKIDDNVKKQSKLMIDYYTDLMSTLPLESYGWYKEDVRQHIVDAVKNNNPEMKPAILQKYQIKSKSFYKDEERDMYKPSFDVLGDYVEAENPVEAFKIAFYALDDQIHDNGYDVKYSDDESEVYAVDTESGEVYQTMYDFIARDTESDKEYRLGADGEVLDENGNVLSPEGKVEDKEEIRFYRELPQSEPEEQGKAQEKKLILPDYTMAQTHPNSYNVSNRTAKLLKAFGVRVNEHPQGKFYVRKSRWENFIASPEWQDYIALKQIFNTAARKVLNDKLNKVNGAESLSNRLSEDYEAISSDSNGAAISNVENIMPQATAMLNYYSDLISILPLDNYGWSKQNVRKAIVDSIENTKMKNGVRELTFAEQVDASLNGTLDRFTDLKIGDTPPLLLAVGCEQKPMFYRQKHLRDAIKPKNRELHQHGLTVEQIKKIPEEIANPVMILDGLKNDKCIRLVLSDFDEDGSPLMAIVRPNGKGNYSFEIQPSNFVLSIYGRDDFSEYISDSIKLNKVLYYNKNRSEGLFSVLGREFPKGLNGLTSDIIIRQSTAFVNTSYENSYENSEENPEGTSEGDNDNNFYREMNTDMQQKIKVGDTVVYRDDRKQEGAWTVEEIYTASDGEERITIGRDTDNIIIPHEGISTFMGDFMKNLVRVIPKEDENAEEAKPETERMYDVNTFTITTLDGKAETAEEYYKQGINISERRHIDTYELKVPAMDKCKEIGGSVERITGEDGGVTYRHHCSEIISHEYELDENGDNTGAVKPESAQEYYHKIPAYAEENRSESEIIEAAQQQARLMAARENQPFVVINWSESSAFKSGDILSLRAAEDRFSILNDEAKTLKSKGEMLGYDKTKFDIYFTDENGEVGAYNAGRFDIGVETDGLIQHIREVSADSLLQPEERSRIAGFADYLERSLRPQEQQKGTAQEEKISKETPAAPAERRNPANAAKDIRNGMVSELVEYIKQNPQNWQRGWRNGYPENGKTGRTYRGLNLLYLSMVRAERGYNDSRWVTFEQAKNLNASVKKGEKSVPIVFYSRYDKKTKRDFDSATVKGMTDEERAEYMKENVYSVLKYSRVFNAEQCQNFPAAKESAMSEEEQAKNNAKIESIIANSEAPVYYDGNGMAYYNPTSDSIHLPPIKDFKTKQDYYATALHEIAHSTGHESRLDRKLNSYDRSNKEKYAVEELRAEIASVLIQGAAGVNLDGSHYENHAAYISSWLSVVEKDNNALMRAIYDAEGISDYVVDRYMKENQESTKEYTPVYTAEQLGAVNVDEFVKAYHNEYSYLYNNEGRFTEEEQTAKSRAAATYDYCLKYDETFKKFAFDVGTKNGDLVTSDREAAAFINTLNKVLKEKEAATVAEKPAASEEKVIAQELPAEPSKIQPICLLSRFEAFEDGRDSENAKWYRESRRISQECIKAIEKGVRENYSYETYHLDTGFLNDIISEYGIDRVNHVLANVMYNHPSDGRYSEENRAWSRAIPTLDEPEVRRSIDTVTHSTIMNGLVDEMRQMQNRAMETSTETAEPAAQPTEPAAPEEKLQAEQQQTETPAEPAQNPAEAPKSSRGAENGQGSGKSSGKVEVASDWRYINLVPSQIGKTYDTEKGSVTQIVMPDGEYSKYSVFVNSRLVHTRETKEGKTRTFLSVNEKSAYTLKRDGLEVKLNGAELAKALNGAEVGKEAVRVAPSYKNTQRYKALDENVPAEMKELPNWVAYKIWWDEKKQKYDKRPISPVNGEYAKSNDAMTWTTYGEAMKFARDNNYAGLGFVLDGKCGISCIDLDHAIDKNGNLNTPAAKLCAELEGKTYTETSVSGNGLHFFVKDDVLQNGKYQQRGEDGGAEIEVYDKGRIISMTGDLRGGNNKLGVCPSATMQYLRTSLGQMPAAVVRPQRATGSNVPKSQNEVEEKILKSKNRDEYLTLKSGGTLNGGDKSKDDWRFLKIVAFYSNCDREIMRSMFMDTALYRPTEKSAGYLDRSIDNVIAKQSRTIGDGLFTPSKRSAAEKKGKGAHP